MSEESFLNIIIKSYIIFFLENTYFLINLIINVQLKSGFIDLLYYIGPTSFIILSHLQLKEIFFHLLLLKELVYNREIKKHLRNLELIIFLKMKKTNKIKSINSFKAKYISLIIKLLFLLSVYCSVFLVKLIQASSLKMIFHLTERWTFFK